MIQMPKKTCDAPCTPDYYLSRTPPFGGLQPHGRWWNLAGLFAIANGSQIDPDGFLNLACGRSPDGKRHLLDTIPSHGIELTFRADPSVSTLWATLDNERRALVEQCQIEAVALSLQAVEWNECVLQEPVYDRFPPTPADIMGVLFQHICADGEPDLHTHCIVLGLTCARGSRTWGRLHRDAFPAAVTAGASIYQRLLMKLLRRRLGLSSEPYDTDALGTHYRVVGAPNEWAMFCGDPAATNPALHPPLYGEF